MNDPSNIDWAKYDDASKYIVLRPTQHFSTHTSKYVAHGVSELQFIDDGKKKDDDDKYWYKSGKMFALNLPALMAICEAAHIRVPDVRFGDSKNPDFGSCIVTGQILMPDMTMRELTGGGTFDVSAVIEENYKNKRKSTADWLRKQSDADIRKLVESERATLQRYRFQRAQSSAYAYMIRKVLQMKTSFTDAETKMTFVIPVISPILDRIFEDYPETRMAFIASAVGASRQIYGSRTEIAPDSTLPPGEQRALLPSHGDAADGHSAQGPSSDPVDRSAAPPPTDDLPPGLETKEQAVANWENADEYERLEKLRELWHTKKHTGTKEEYVTLTKGDANLQARAIWQLQQREAIGGDA